MEEEMAPMDLNIQGMKPSEIEAEKKITNKFSEYTNLYVQEGEGFFVQDGKELVIQKGFIYRFSPGEVVEIVAKTKLVLYSAQ